MMNRISEILSYTLISLFFTGNITARTDPEMPFPSELSEGRCASQATTSEGLLHLEGASLFYKIIGSGDPIIVLHGGPGLNHRYLLTGLPELSKNHRMIFYDQRGSGQSVPAILDEKQINISQFVGDIESLRVALGLEKFTLLGHSWGGMLAMHYALKHPENLSSLILLNSMPATSRGVRSFIDEYNNRMADIAEEIDEIKTSEGFIQGDPEKVAAFYKLIFSKYFYDAKKASLLPLSFDAASTLSAFQVSAMLQNWIISSDIDLLPKLRRLSVPTLVVHGDLDPIPLWSAEELASSIPNGELIVLKNCGHFPFVEKPIELNSAINRFIDKKKAFEVKLETNFEAASL